MRAMVVMPDDSVPNQVYFAQRNMALIREMIAVCDKARRAARSRARAAGMAADVPKAAGDMDVRGRTVKGKLIYSWGDSVRGRVEVEVTPRAHRAPLPDGASAFQRTTYRETTPERALRKVAQKVRHLRRWHACFHERLVARAVSEPSIAAPAVFEMEGHPAVCGLQQCLCKTFVVVCGQDNDLISCFHATALLRELRRGVACLR